MTAKRKRSNYVEGFEILRFLFVVGSMAPLFILLMVRGVPVINNKPFINERSFDTACLLLICVPAIVLLLRWNIVRKEDQTSELKIGDATDHRDHLIAYLLAIVMPLYQVSYSTRRDVYASMVATLLILFLFMNMNLHYMNLVFAFMGYRAYTVQPVDTAASFSGNVPYVVLSRRASLSVNQIIIAYKLSNTVFIEKAS